MRCENEPFVARSRLQRVNPSITGVSNPPSFLIRYYLRCGVESRLQDLAMRLVARLFALVVLDKQLEEG